MFFKIALASLISIVSNISACQYAIDCYPNITEKIELYDGIEISSTYIYCTNSTCFCLSPCFTLSSLNDQCQLSNNKCVTFDFNNLECVDQRISKAINFSLYLNFKLKKFRFWYYQYQH